MSQPNAKLESERQLILQAKERGRLATAGAYLRLSGPGWLQSALTLGGGSLASSLYLGVLAGVSLLWLQPVAMVFGIIMLSAIGYVTMSTGERPFRAINEHVNPVLGWGWALASLAANMVWALPQYSLATSVLQQNLNVLPDEPGSYGGKIAIVTAILLLTTAITWSYGSGGWGVRLYETVLKLMVALIVACFIGVVVKLALAEEGVLRWGEIFAGFIPDVRRIFTPADSFLPLLDEVGAAHREYWTGLIVSQQRDVLISAAATAVGINMTFLFPYSILKRGWGKEFRGLAIFDLGTGMFIPYVLATSCVVIASQSQFHARPAPGFLGETDSAGAPVEPEPRMAAEYQGLLEGRVRLELDGSVNPPVAEALEAELQRRVADVPEAEKRIAAALVRRDAGDLAKSLRPLTRTGEFDFSNLIFGLGVLGMALSTITLLMLVSGFVVCEILGLPPGGWPHRLGCLAAATGVLGPFIFEGSARFWLAVPASVFGFTLIPIAYLTFFLLMNQRGLLREEMPRGGRRLAWNTAMGLATAIVFPVSVIMIWVKAGVWGLAGAGVFLLAALLVGLGRRAGRLSETFERPDSR